MHKVNKSGQEVEEIPEVDVARIGNASPSCGTTATNGETSFAHQSKKMYESKVKSVPDSGQNDTASDTTVSVSAEVAVDASVVPQSNTNDISAIDRSARQNAIDSDKDYRRITEKIIDKTCDQLKKHTEAKAPLRKKLSNFIIGLLLLQFLVLVGMLFLNRKLNLQISDFILNIYIVSVFVETLAGLIIMIKFAFDSKQEVELIKILNAIITNFKKYDEK